jgi:hypothetical protein
LLARKHNFTIARGAPPLASLREVLVVAGVCLVVVLLTVLLLPGTSGRSLEELSEEAEPA